MSNDPARRARLNVPSPHPERSSYARFIPREELHGFSSWSPDSLGGLPPPQRRQAEPAPGPTAEEWLARVDAARRQGREEGYREGLAALVEREKKLEQQLAAQLAQFTRALDAEFDGLHEELADAVTRIALQLARQVLRSELQLAPELVLRVAGEAIEAVVQSATQLTVYVHAQDLPLLAEGLQNLLESRGARLLAHPEIERGGCRVESDVGSVDARVATRWAQAAAALGGEIAWDEEQAP